MSPCLLKVYNSFFSVLDVASFGLFQLHYCTCSTTCCLIISFIFFRKENYHRNLHLCFNRLLSTFCTRFFLIFKITSHIQHRWRVSEVLSLTILEIFSSKPGKDSLVFYIRFFRPIKAFCCDVNHCHTEYWISEGCLLPSCILLILWSYYNLVLIFCKTYCCTVLFQEFLSGLSK